MTTTTNWEKDFDYNFVNKGGNIWEYPDGAVKAFIRSLLAKQRSELLDLVEKIVNECVREFHGPVDVTGILDEHDFRKKLSTLRKEGGGEVSRQQYSKVFDGYIHFNKL